MNLHQSTNDMIEHVDQTIVSSEAVKTRLVAALKNVFPNMPVFNYEYLDART